MAMQGETADAAAPSSPTPGRKKRGTGQLFGISPFAPGAGSDEEEEVEEGVYKAKPSRVRMPLLLPSPAAPRARLRQGVVVTGLEGIYARFNGVYYPDLRAPKVVQDTARPHRQHNGDGTIEYWSREGVPGWVINQNYGSKFFYNASEELLPPEDGWKQGYGGMLPVPTISYTTRQEQARRSAHRWGREVARVVLLPACIHALDRS